MGISSSTPSSTGAAAWQQQHQNFNQLSQALKSGDLAAAQKAFATLPSSNSVDPNSHWVNLALL